MYLLQIHSVLAIIHPGSIKRENTEGNMNLNVDNNVHIIYRNEKERMAYNCIADVAVKN